MVDAFHERRSFARYDQQTRWKVYHLPTGRLFPCRCLDVSAGGAKFSASLYMPVRPGHELKLIPGELSGDNLNHLLDAEEIDAVVVWVNRESILTSGQVQFAAGFSA